MTNSTWTNTFLDQLITAWEKNAYEGTADAQLALDAVSGFMLAVDLAAAETNDEVLDATSRHLAVISQINGKGDTSNLLHAALLNITVTFLLPALNILAGTDQDVRSVAQQMQAVMQPVAGD